MNKKKDEIKRLEEAVRMAEKGGNFDTVHHVALAAIKKRPKAVSPPKEVNDG